VIPLRSAADTDWPNIRRLAGESAPWAGDMNDVWLAARRAFDATTRTRRHYAALHDGGTAIAYGAIEQDVGAPTYRLFVVTASSRLNDGTGDALLGRLLDDLRSVRAGRAWMREEARDPLLRARRY
jgi:hypothetical protein